MIGIDDCINDASFEEFVYEKYKEKEGHCFFFNAANAIFSNAKQYLLLRYIVSMFYNILSNINITHDEVFKHNDWLTSKVLHFLPRRLMEFYFNNNELIDDDDLSHQAKFMKYEKNMFGFTSAGNIDQFYGIMSDGFSHEKRVIFSKMARCYVQPNFYGDTSTMEIIGHLFAVKFGVVNAKANSEVVLIHDDVYKQDFALELGTFGCGYDSLTSTFFPFFQIDAKLNNKSYEYFEFWLASTEGCNHYVHFYDSNFAEKNYDRLVPIHNLTSFSSSIWNHCISRFLLMSRNYQTPIIVDDDKMDMKSIFYEKGKFVFDKPILFRNKAYEVLQMNISLPFERKQSR